tara:strand:- start:6121 stop:6339 length:219 start_codon:yes stop_codon:yes gene_type:complete
MKNIINIKGRKDVVRDRGSGAVLSTDMKSLSEYKRKSEDQTRIKILEEKTNAIENELSEMKQMLTILINRGN